MFTLIFLLIALIPLGMAGLILEIAPENNKHEACKPALVALVIIALGFYLDYKFVLSA